MEKPRDSAEKCSAHRRAVSFVFLPLSGGGSVVFLA
jgi:hypothetical protein